MLPIILAHGNLGWWDDLIFLGIIVVFLGVMIVSWFLSRNDNFEADDIMPKPKNTPSDDPERFTLD